MTAGADADTDVASNEAVVLFDGVCTLCNGLVAVLLPRPRRATLYQKLSYFPMWQITDMYYSS